MKPLKLTPTERKMVKIALESWLETLKFVKGFGTPTKGEVEIQKLINLFSE